MLEINTRPKSTALHDQIRKHILEGQFFPGQWLKQADLENIYQASRSEVRGALSTLAERGIVEYIKNRGFRIYDRSPEEIREISEMIVVLETAAAPSIIKNVTPPDIDELERLAKKFDDLITTASHAELRLTNYRFHNALNALCDNKMIARTIRNLRECCVSGPFQRYTTFSGLQESSREHFEIINAVKNRDADTLEGLLQQHAMHST